MTVARSLEGLVGLHRLEDADARRRAWRQGMATLAAEAANQAPAPLEGLPPEPLRASLRVAIDDALVDDLGWLSAPAAAVALYELAAALPVCPERRVLGRRVATELHEGDAATFVALATVLATSSRRGLTGAPIRARVAIALDLPIGTGTRADALALALVSRRDLAREWLAIPATGSLPSRRLAARLLERAAREAAMRVSRGDDGALRVFESEPVRTAWVRLLGDRESLVWRHVAVARGLLSGALPSLSREIEVHLDPALTPTEWRRAAASLAATIAFQPDAATERARAMLAGPIPERDAGVAGAMVFGLPRAAEAEPQAAEQMLEILVRRGGLYAVEALVELLDERVAPGFGAVAAELARRTLATEIGTGAGGDDGKVALVEALEDELAPYEGRAGMPLRERLAAARLAFAERGAREAHRRAREVLGAARATLATLERTHLDDSEGRRRSFRALRDLDAGLLETSALSDLLFLGQSDEASDPTAPLEEMHERLTSLLTDWEAESVLPGIPVAHTTLRLRRLRSLLHLVDAESTPPDAQARAPAVRDRHLRAARLLLRRVKTDAPSPLRRTVCAALARAIDALVRHEVWELSDAFVAVADDVVAFEDLTTLAEASMEPEVESVLSALATLVRRSEPAPDRPAPRVRIRLRALGILVTSFPSGLSPRTEALRSSLQHFARELDSVLDAPSLRALAAEGEGPLAALEHATHDLARLVAGARRRLGAPVPRDEPRAGSAVRWLLLATERAARGRGGQLDDLISASNRALHEELPRAVADVGVAVLERIGTLPTEAPAPIPLVTRSATTEPDLPPWMPPSRTLGGFHVIRSIGTGAVGTVFVAKRIEDRQNPDAERFALKVPRYDGDAARLLTEEQFERLFRDEAGALLAIPRSPNLARFVTFDVGARPKPILVMELVEGPTFERTIERGDLDVARAMSILDGIAAGLELMHGVGVGHLDVKPSNVILRSREPPAPEGPTPVLVDFGLAGRHLRPGCATAHYGAPEIWGLVPEGCTPSPMAADSYAFGCLAFEALTGNKLFEASTDMALVSAHVGHDGVPPGIEELARRSRFRPVVEVLASALRRDPRDRADLVTLRAGLSGAATGIAAEKWPLRT